MKKTCTRNTNLILYFGEKFYFKITEPPGRVDTTTIRTLLETLIILKKRSYPRNLEAKRNERNLPSKIDESKALSRI